MSRGSLGPRMFWGTRATIFSIYTTKMEGAGLKILGSGAKFKQVPCQKNCRVNRAKVAFAPDRATEVKVVGVFYLPNEEYFTKGRDCIHAEHETTGRPR